ncbi:YggS family pyridoxal phosphate-dependent enzyme [Desulfosediminicola sp.]|uniref:YggS family pyridoxal phosphate-dependent enzyme n=1 Tax=Desulfosediminicola sp. TaxID=2886825 RepID=UPI003AF2D71D
MSIDTNLKAIYDKINTVALSCGREPDEIQLVAVSKRFPVTAIEEAYAAGHTVFGENYIQEAEEKAAQLGGKCTLHFIGHLQRNKAKIAARIFDVIETIDSFKLANTLNRHLEDLGRSMKILLQVNIGEDEKKSGMAAQQTEQLLREIGQLPHLEVIGLMTMPPFTDDPEDARPYFRQLKQLADSLAGKGLFANERRVELSMGMSNDYHVAIEEGATIIRVGTAIFGQRK